VEGRWEMGQAPFDRALRQHFVKQGRFRHYRRESRSQADRGRHYQPHSNLNASTSTSCSSARCEQRINDDSVSRLPSLENFCPDQRQDIYEKHDPVIFPVVRTPNNVDTESLNEIGRWS